MDSVRQRSNVIGMIRGRIAIPDKDPKTWRAKGRKRPQPAMASRS